MKTIKHSLLSIAAISLSVPAHAQPSEPPQSSEAAAVKIRSASLSEETQQSKPLARASASGADNRSRANMEEVIVTAQKREELLQDVPISISVLSGENLDASRMQGVSEALQAVPGVNVYQHGQGAGTVIAIRGAAPGGYAAAGASTSAYYLDTIPFGFVRSADVPDAAAYDLDRVEVLRGPQGTLYGAAAMNGVVRVLTRDADLNDLDLKVRTSFSETSDGGGNYRGDVAANVPIIEGKLAARAVVSYQDLSGWIDQPGRVREDVNDAEIRDYRLKLSGQPTDRLSVGLSAWRSVADYSATPTSDGSGIQIRGGTEPIDSEYSAYGLKVGYEWSAVKISSATSYLDYDNLSDLNLADLPNEFILTTGRKSRVFAEEVLLSSKLNGPWRWSVGAFYRDDKDTWFSDLPAVFSQPTDYDDLSKSVAVFGEVGRYFMQDRLELTLGLRRFHDEVNTVTHTYWTGIIPADQPFTFDATTPRAVLTWKSSENLMVYGSYAQGFRSGVGQQPFLTVDFPGFVAANPDKLNNYEIGTKGSLLSGKVAFDATAWYVDWNDSQQVLNVDVSNGAGVYALALVNSEGVSGAGVDFGLAVNPTSDLEFSLSVSWNDLTFDRAVMSGGTLLFESGQRLNLSAEYTAGIFADYEFSLGASGFRGRISASGNYTSALQQSYVLGTMRDLITGDEILTAQTSFSVTSPEQHWTMRLFVDNATNEQSAVLPTGDGNSLRLRPRTIGAQLEYHLR